MLTGDKMETAENIARSCNLIQRGFHVLRYQENAREGGNLRRGENVVVN
jgi:magnesium-transporting ATPase (P-type)